MLIIVCSQLDAHYPHFPSEQECMRAIVGGDVDQQSNLYLLPTFAMYWERLQVGGALLPDLIEFYTWLHKNLAHLLTIKKASTITIGRVVSLVEKKKGKELGKHIRDLYNRVKEQYNRYVDLIGGAIGAGACAAMHRENQITKITDDVPILHFLSGSYV